VSSWPDVSSIQVDTGNTRCNQFRRLFTPNRIHRRTTNFHFLSFNVRTFFAAPAQPFNQVMANVALRAETDKIILGGMGMTNDDYLYFPSMSGPPSIGSPKALKKRPASCSLTFNVG